VHENLWSALGAISTPATLETGSLVFRSGEPAPAAYVIRTGKIALVWDSPNGAYPLETVGPGGIIGLSAALSEHYRLTARVVEDSELGFIPTRRLRSFLAECEPALMEAALKVLTQEVIKMRAMILSDPERLRWHGWSRRYGGQSF
jgi:CRP-like cAMP-binding protein